MTLHLRPVIQVLLDELESRVPDGLVGTKGLGARGSFVPPSGTAPGHLCARDGPLLYAGRMARELWVGRTQILFRASLGCRTRPTDSSHASGAWAALREQEIRTHRSPPATGVEGDSRLVGPLSSCLQIRGGTHTSRTIEGARDRVGGMNVTASSVQSFM